MKISIGILGISGRMGKALSNLIVKDPILELVGGVRKEGSDDLQQSISSLASKADVIIDFSSPSALCYLLKASGLYKKPLIIGTTGYSPEQLTEIKNASKSIPILQSFNFSLGIAICNALTKSASQKAIGLFNIEISETHHINKKDRPSGTALILKKATNDDNTKIRSFRRGNVIGKHRVCFYSDEEKFEISHEALSRDVFARGAIACAKYIIHKPPKLYSIEDIFS
jgi:4-hydroxy-tetrahydrodipicolinate reductase